MQVSFKRTYRYIINEEKKNTARNDQYTQLLGDVVVLHLLQTKCSNIC